MHRWWYVQEEILIADNPANAKSVPVPVGSAVSNPAQHDLSSMLSSIPLEVHLANRKKL